MRSDDDIGRSREVVELFESKVVDFNRVIFQFQDVIADTLGINKSPDSIDFCIVLFLWGFVLYVEFEVGIDGVSAFQVPERVPHRSVKNGMYLLVVCSSEGIGEAGKQ